jgi:hypothetical protein
MPRSSRTYRTRGIARVFATGILLVGAALIPVGSAGAAEQADIVRDWHRIAIAAISNPATADPPGAGQPPPYSPLHVAMVQGAVYDAVNAIDRGHAPYLANLPTAPASASRAAAVAAAARGVLVDLVPPLPQAVRNSVNSQYAASLSEITDGSAKSQGIAVGAAAAAAMLANRAGDGRYVQYSFTAGFGPGQWRAEVPNFASDPFAWVARVRPFTMKSPSQFRTEGPPSMTSAQYAAEFNEVKALGALNNSTRSPEQTTLARFVSANPIVFMNAGLRDISEDAGLSLVDEARLYAMTSMASADALVACWDDKDHWRFWRPITAIRQAAADGNDATTAQADWLPFLPTPPYPDHPSGYNCYTAALMHAAKAFFGTDKVEFRLTSPGSNTTRSYSRFTDVVRDTIEGRIYTGFHFRTADVQGAWIGKKVAQWTAKHYFEAVD